VGGPPLACAADRSRTAIAKDAASRIISLDGARSLHWARPDRHTFQIDVPGPEYTVVGVVRRRAFRVARARAAEPTLYVLSVRMRFRSLVIVAKNAGGRVSDDQRHPRRDLAGRQGSAG
jgi:hypothetical protein